MAIVAKEIAVRLALVAKFPALRKFQFELTSPVEPRYNCIAWAAGEDHRYWWPTAHWPKGASRQVTRASFIKAFGTKGYVVCDNPDLEGGFEKVALYEDADGIPTHAARLLPNGRWTSKLGKSVDISHSLEGLIGDEYGKPTLFMRRPLPANP
jgi:hypothetical protein